HQRPAISARTGQYDQSNRAPSRPAATIGHEGRRPGRASAAGLGGGDGSAVVGAAIAGGARGMRGGAGGGARSVLVDHAPGPVRTSVRILASTTTSGVAGPGGPAVAPRRSWAGAAGPGGSISRRGRHPNSGRPRR